MERDYHSTKRIWIILNRKRHSVLSVIYINIVHFFVGHERHAHRQKVDSIMALRVALFVLRFSIVLKKDCFLGIRPKDMWKYSW